MIKPLHDRVVVKPLEDEKVTQSGIIIPDTVKEKPTKGIVKFVGPGKKDEPMTVKEGETVIFSKYSPDEIDINNEKYFILKESDILAII